VRSDKKMAIVLVIYHTKTGNTKEIAKEVESGK
jgi:flavodoxin